MSKLLFNLIVRPLLFLLSLLPFWVLYGIANFLAFVLNSLIGYRKKVIETNLHQCFPNKSELEMEQLIKAYYISISDYMVESIKMITISKKSLMKRYRCQNPELLAQYYKQRSDVALLVPHYGNWEWGAFTLPLISDYLILALYKPLSNKLVDKYLKSVRERFGITLVPFKNIFRTYVKHKNEPKLTVYIADQSPALNDARNWVMFFDYPTAAIAGTEKIIRKTNNVALYAHINRVKRGYYVITILPISENPEKEKPNFITEQFFNLMEESIKNDPIPWIWSHRRWKIQPEELDLQIIQQSLKN
jgi:KDO2-lipid IV(A) lauroyltransferase